MKIPYAPINIILADDHEIFRDGFQSLMQNQQSINLLAEAANGRQLVSLTERFMPDVVLTDIKMPVMDGIEATRIITDRFPQVGIIALSMFNDDELIIDMLEAGAKGYLLKNAHKKEILEAISTVSWHRPYYCSATSIRLAQLVAASTHSQGNTPARMVFTDKEKEIIRLICREFSNKEMSVQLNLSVRTIEGYRERILEKTKAKNTAGLVIYAIRNHIFIP